MANYGDKGWIKLWRAEMNDPLYRDEPFTKWQAWIDLCMMADDKGAVKTSIKALKIRWLWGSETKVRNYLKAVKESGKGAVISTPNKGTLIRINTDFFANPKKYKNKKKEADKEAGKKFEEVTSFKEVGRASFEVSPPTSENKKKYSELMKEILDDEYE